MLNLVHFLMTAQEVIGCQLRCQHRTNQNSYIAGVYTFGQETLRTIASS